eukprot:TRINITY_DN6591_c0_g2_i1.p1 TRINITY_DN6591_c0_g2~~TRINITY_DN6591_c0_g2_i1.p1  ORF type:complete len:640 (-),score=178.11 TRINITY_DN6591_c0_g2_i1:428-2347(-)
MAFAVFFQEGLQKELIGGDVNDRPLADFAEYLKTDSKDEAKTNRELALFHFSKEIQKLILKNPQSETIPNTSVAQIYEKFYNGSSPLELNDGMVLPLSGVEVSKDALKKVLTNALYPLHPIYTRYMKSLKDKKRDDLKQLDVDLLEGEQILIPAVEDIEFLDYIAKRRVKGSLIFSNYQIQFAVYDAIFQKWEARVKVPYAAIMVIEKVPGQNPANDQLIQIRCKDSRIVRFDFKGKTEAKAKCERLMSQMAFPENPHGFFAFSYKYVPPSPRSNDAIPKDGWQLYNIFEEMLRMQLPVNKWKISDINHEYVKAKTYPSKIVVPIGMTDEDLDSVFAYRSKGRIPALTWVHPITRAALVRSSQPLAGIKGNRCAADEKLLDLIRTTSTSDTLYILDARPKANAMTNQVIKGMGFENENNYPNCKIEFLNIPNIHTMRDSLNKLYILCQSGEDEKYLTRLEATKWMEYSHIILTGAVRIANLLEDGCPVLIHCSDGWDRTAQLGGIAQLLLDGYYRTIVGFQVLIEKEWLSFGHRFQKRIGHGMKNFEDDQRSPVFLQFLDCVYQIFVQFPCSFEFNLKFLLEIMDQLYSCRFGTFLFNHSKNREAIVGKTVSLWTYINANLDQYVNVFYMPGMFKLKSS